MNSDTITSNTGLSEISETRVSAQFLTRQAGALRGQVSSLNAEGQELHRKTLFDEWVSRTADRGKQAPDELLAELSELGFAWRDIARMIGVTVPAIQKWRKTGKLTGENRNKIAGLVAACDLISEHYLVQEVASWFEMPLVMGCPLTPIDLYSGGRFDLMFDYASEHSDPSALLTEFDPEWRDNYRAQFEARYADDGRLSLHPKAGP